VKSTYLVSVEYLCSVAQAVQLQHHARHFLVAYSRTVQKQPFTACYCYAVISM